MNCKILLVLLVSSVAAQVNIPNRNANQEAIAFLTEYGYLDPKLTQPTTVKEAIIEFQKFNGIPVTGIVDARTIELMRSPRCGVADKLHDPSDFQVRFQTYAYKWLENKLTYKISKYPRGWKSKDVDQTVAKAFNLWSQVTDLTFQRMNSDPVDIDVRFEVGVHGDDSPFDGRGKIVAHATLPKNGGAYIHFDEAETWTINKEGVTDMLRVAVHEIGHVLGLKHSHLKSAVMHSTSSRYVRDLRLHSDDINGIQSLYGKPKTGQRGNLELCRSKTFDTVFAMPDGRTYIFKGDKYWLLAEDTLAPGYPRYINASWSGLPRDLDAAVSAQQKTYFFKDLKFWRYSGFRMDAGYPKLIASSFPGIPSGRVSAVLKWKDESLVFFKGDKYYFWDLASRGRATTHPMKDWGGVPSNVSSAIQMANGNYYFFKGDSYWRLNKDKIEVEPGYPRSIAKWWFNC